jgi:tripartite-type tricarboxylate transporter receptor subunit TctC
MTRPFARIPGLRRRTFAAAAAALLTATCAFAQQPFPSRPLKIIVPAPPAGAADTATRVIARHMETTLGQPVVVENRPGAATMIGMQLLEKAQPDGYTIGLASVAGSAIVGVTNPNAPDLRKELVTIGGVVNAPHVLAVSATLPAKTAQELVALFKKEPGKHNFASQGEGSLSHLESELFKSSSGVDLQHIPYTGSSLAMPGLISGTTSMMFDSAASVAPHVKAGKLRVLGTTASHRVRQFPDAPTMIELGMTRFRADNPFGFYAPAGTPPAVAKALSQAVEAALAAPESIQALQAAGLEPRFTPPAEFQKIVAAEYELWQSVARTATKAK